jgi:hypothetical protein
MEDKKLCISIFWYFVWALYMRLFDYEYPLLLLLETKDHPMLLKCHWVLEKKQIRKRKKWQMDRRTACTRKKRH